MISPYSTPVGKSGTDQQSSITLLIQWYGSLRALMVREVRARFSGDPLGYTWAFVTPLVWIASIAVIFSLVGRLTPIHTDIISFLIAGMLPYTIFRTTISATMRISKAQKNMRYFANISANDILVASTLMELMNAILIYIVLMAGNELIFSHFEVADPAMTMFGFTLAWGLGASFGHMAVAFTQISEATVRFVPILLRPMFWLSGIFFVANELPGGLLNVMQYNPLLQAIEIMRSASFLGYSSRIADPLIPLAWIVGMNLTAVLIKTLTAKKQYNI